MPLRTASELSGEPAVFALRFLGNFISSGFGTMLKVSNDRVMMRTITAMAQRRDCAKCKRSERLKELKGVLIIDWEIESEDTRQTSNGIWRFDGYVYIYVHRKYKGDGMLAIYILAWEWN